MLKQQFLSVVKNETVKIVMVTGVVDNKFLFVEISKTKGVNMHVQLIRTPLRRDACFYTSIPL